MIDIDYFKQYNDTYGHLAGDETLKCVARTLGNVFENDLVARYGGEEFCVFTRESELGLKQKLDALQSEIYKLKIEHKGSKINNYLTLSLGVHGDILKQEKDIDEFINYADQKLYESKEAGRNRYTL